ncbi:MAG: glycosyltransferase [Bacteroidales bacterium]|jgi:glycosyltransferase involved in cell wall biosynthesis|nr:glycosyltransferase [Bacteroidales bacterium]
MPKISIFIPVFNAQNYLAECLNSIRNQTFENWECLIIDDGSTDESTRIIDTFLKSDARFKAFYVEHCGNIQKNKDFARSKASGDWFFDVDADDFLDLDCLEILINRQEQTNADIVLLQLKFINEQATQILKKTPEDNFDFWQIISGQVAGMLTIGEWNIPANGLFHKNLYTAANFDLSNDTLNLDEYVSQALLFDAKLVAFCQAGYYYRQHPKSRTKAPTLLRFAILYSDKLREELVILHFGEQSKEARIAKTASMRRFLGLYALFFQFKKRFSKDQKKHINALFSDTFKGFSKKEIWHSHLHFLKKWLLLLPRPFVVFGCKFYAFLKKVRP